MASRKREDVGDITVAILRSIRDEIRHLRTDTNERFEKLGARVDAVGSRVDAVGSRVSSLESRFDALEVTTARGFEAVTLRLENIRDLSGERWRDLERRVRRLEAKGASR